MTAARSLAFGLFALLWTSLVCLLYLPLLACSRRVIQAVARLWSRGLLRLAAWCCGLTYRIEGCEHLPTGAAILAAKHQSAWDTLIFHNLVPDPVYLLKKELVAVPLFGWYLKASGSIAVDRAAGFRAIKAMLPAVTRAVAAGSQIVIFPEGTRVAAGQTRRYQPGIAALYGRLALPVVPIALNSGAFWGRRSFLKYPGVITLRALPAIQPGLTREAFMRELQRRIETATAELCADVGIATTPASDIDPATSSRPALARATEHNKNI
jgi:1-acyl-sn-glycerol-3-phosphate acyltransferase